MIHPSTTACTRCGVCCEQGGPALHRADRALVEQGRIPGRCLFTLRRGELARDNVVGGLRPLAAEVIKINGRRPAWTCRFYDREGRGCTIYRHRPLECRVLNCRDTRRIEAIYAVDRLSRRDLLSGIKGLWDLIDDHERRCSYATLAGLVGHGARGGRLVHSDAIMEMLRFDTHLRRLTVDRGQLDARMLDFIFGRPLTDTIGMFAIELVNHGNDTVVVPGPDFANAVKRCGLVVSPRNRRSR